MKLAASPVAILKKRVESVHEHHRQYKELQNAHIHTHSQRCCRSAVITRLHPISRTIFKLLQIIGQICAFDTGGYLSQRHLSWGNP